MNVIVNRVSMFTYLATHSSGNYVIKKLIILLYQYIPYMANHFDSHPHEYI
jgi:hypothetical protein